MTYAIFFKHLSFDSELYTVRLKQFWDPFSTGRGQWRSKAEPIRAEPARAEPSWAGPGLTRAQSRHAKPSRAESSRAETSRAGFEPSRAKQNAAEPSRRRPTRYFVQKQTCLHWVIKFVHGNWDIVQKQLGYKVSVKISS